MNVAVVVLNFNDSDTTIACVNKLLGMSAISSVVVVDNHSDSYVSLQHYCSNHSKVTFIRSTSNGGYASGNNIGVRCAISILHAEYVIVSNPDASFDDIFVKLSLKTFIEYPDAGEVSCLISDSRGFDSPAMREPSFLRLLVSNIPLIGRSVLGLHYPKAYFKSDICEVGQVRGSLFMISSKAYLDINGFDEGTFLYYEEAVLGKMLHNKGYKIYLRTDCSYDHLHSTTIQKVFRSRIERMRLMYESQRFYCNKYLTMNPIKNCLLEKSQRINLFMYSIIWKFRKSR